MKPIKEQLKGTCVLNEKEEMGAEIVALYTEAGFENRHNMQGATTASYYGELDGKIWRWFYYEPTLKILTLSQLREIVKGKQETHEYKEPIKWEFASELYEAPKEWQDEFKKANPDMKHSEEPQFKAGDVVEVETIREYGLCKIIVIVENKVWLRPFGQTEFIVDISQIRHPKDKLREKAEEIMAKRRKHDFSGVEYFTVGATEEMLIEAIKWSQENPKP